MEIVINNTTRHAIAFRGYDLIKSNLPKGLKIVSHQNANDVKNFNLGHVSVELANPIEQKLGTYNIRQYIDSFRNLAQTYSIDEYLEMDNSPTTQLAFSCLLGAPMFKTRVFLEDLEIMIKPCSTPLRVTLSSVLDVLPFLDSVKPDIQSNQSFSQQFIKVKNKSNDTAHPLNLFGWNRNCSSPNFGSSSALEITSPTAGVTYGDILNNTCHTPFTTNLMGVTVKNNMKKFLELQFESKITVGDPSGQCMMTPFHLQEIDDTLSDRNQEDDLLFNTKVKIDPNTTLNFSIPPREEVIFQFLSKQTRDTKRIVLTR